MYYSYKIYPENQLLHSNFIVKYLICIIKSDSVIKVVKKKIHVFFQALRVSMEEERARQEDEARKAANAPTQDAEMPSAETTGELFGESLLR